MIELIVVVAIVVILAAILIPVIRSVRVSAENAESVSRLRSLGEAISLFTSDNNGRYPGSGIIYTERWLHQVAPYLGFESTGSMDGVPLYEDAYQRDEYFTCPALHGEPIPNGKGEYPARYGMNLRIAGGQRTTRGVPSVAVKDPAETVLLATKASGTPHVRPNPYPEDDWGVAANLRPDRNPEGGTDADGFMGKHAYTFCDGHVEVREHFIGSDAFRIRD